MLPSYSFFRTSTLVTRCEPSDQPVGDGTDQAQLPTACAPPPPPNFDHVSLQEIEVVRAVQNLAGSVPLIAGKKTFVRVYLDKTNGTRPLTATLKARRGATSVTLNPVFPIIVNATENLTVRRHGHATAPASSAVNSRRFAALCLPCTPTRPDGRCAADFDPTYVSCGDDKVRQGHKQISRSHLGEVRFAPPSR